MRFRYARRIAEKTCRTKIVRMKKRKVKAKWDEDVEAVVRRWEYLPSHVRRTIAEMVLHYGPAAGEARSRMVLVITSRTASRASGS